MLKKVLTPTYPNFLMTWPNQNITKFNFTAYKTKEMRKEVNPN